MQKAKDIPLLPFLRDTKVSTITFSSSCTISRKSFWSLTYFPVLKKTIAWRTKDADFIALRTDTSSISGCNSSIELKKIACIQMEKPVKNYNKVNITLLRRLLRYKLKASGIQNPRARKVYLKSIYILPRAGSKVARRLCAGFFIMRYTLNKKNTIATAMVFFLFGAPSGIRTHICAKV